MNNTHNNNFSRSKKNGVNPVNPSTGHQSEIQLQAACFQWAFNTYPATRKLLFHVPNGGSRNAIEGMQLKASGVVPGVPDLLFLWRGTLHAFELKTTIGTVSPDQTALHAKWKEHNIHVHIIRDLETFQNLFKAIISE